MRTDGVEQVIRTGLAGAEELPQADLHKRMAEHRAYLHPYRWTSLGLALLEAMTLGMPVLALAATGAPRPSRRRRPGVRGRRRARRARPRARRRSRTRPRRRARPRAPTRWTHYGLERFLADWDRLLEEVTR